MLVLVSGSYSGNGIHTDHDCAGGVVFRASTRLPPWIVPSRPSRLPRLCIRGNWTGGRNGMTPLMIAAQAPILKCETCPMKDIHWET
jgi:hypothetical protein